MGTGHRAPGACERRPIAHCPHDARLAIGGWQSAVGPGLQCAMGRRLQVALAHRTWRASRPCRRPRPAGVGAFYPGRGPKAPTREGAGRRHDPASRDRGLPLPIGAPARCPVPGARCPIPQPNPLHLPRLPPQIYLPPLPSRLCFSVVVFSCRCPVPGARCPLPNPPDLPERRPPVRACNAPVRACKAPVRACKAPVQACEVPVRACNRPVRARIPAVRACVAACPGGRGPKGPAKHAVRPRPSPRTPRFCPCPGPSRPVEGGPRGYRRPRRRRAHHTARAARASTPRAMPPAAQLRSRIESPSTMKDAA